MKKVLCVLLLFGIMILGSSTSSQAQVYTFFGEDLYPNLGANLTNSNAAHADFLSYLSGDIGTEDFESFAVGTNAPLTVDFGAAGTATLTGGGAIQDGYSYGRFPISGNQYWEASTSTGMFGIEFSAPVAAFGFYGTDIGDFSGQITITTMNGEATSYDIPHTIGAPNASALYWGIINMDEQFTSITFSNTGSSSDWFGFDDFSIGSVEQVQPIPEPASLLLLGAGLLGIAGIQRYRRKK